MKITDVQCFCPIYEIGRFGEARAVVLKITTDEGLFGLGEGTLSYPFCLSKQVVAAIAGAKQYLIGSDPLQIEKIWHELYDRYFWRGGPVEGSAQGAINYALWDIFGKSVNMPVYQLLGGAYHERIPIYLNGWWEGTSTTKEVVERALVTVEKGATRLKWYPFEFMSQIGNQYFVSSADLKRGIDEVFAVREAVGPSVDLMVDIWRRLDISSAVLFCREVERANLVFVEEPIPAENLDSMIKLSRTVNTRLATGERILSRYDFSKLFEAQAIGIAQINIGRVGGITEARKIAAMADNHGIGVAPHNPIGSVATAAIVQLSAHMRNFLMLERFPPFQDEWMDQNLVYGPDYIELPVQPGIGVTVDERFLANFAV